MKLAYVTALFPFAPAEQFFEPEVRELARRVELLVIPARPGKRNAYPELGAPALRLALFGPRTLGLALREFGRAPRAVLEVFGAVAFGRNSLQARAVNLAVFPKALAVAHEIRRLGIEHVHAAWLTTPATIAYVAARLNGIPFSITAHQHDIFAGNLTAEKIRRARFTRAISQRNCAHLRERLALPLRARCTVGHLGVELPPETGDAPARAPRLLCAARLCAWKGHRYLLAALAQLRDRGLSFSCDLAGGGELHAAVAREIQRLHLGEHVRLLGNVPHARLTASLARGDYDLFALASTERPGEHEGIPVAAMEAMAAGVPVVATRTGSLDELVDDANGALVAQRDPLALADALERYLRDAGLRRAAGVRARARIAAEFESGATTQRLLDLLGDPAPAPAYAPAAPC
jgi:colanic acid/amylovoran biosynthesis glycosyltransferase